jgi:hypothetical protein
MLKLNYEVSPQISAYGNFSFATTNSNSLTQQIRDTGIVVSSGNPYIPASIQSQMTALGLNSITLARIDDDIGDIKVTGLTHNYRAVGGLKGSLGSSSWTWDTHFEYGEYTQATAEGPNNRIQANWLLEIDAVRNPANGQIVCRSTLTNPNNGCVPENPFGNGNLTVNNFAFGSALYNITTDERDAAVNVQGDLFKVPAGPVTVAMGGEWRSEQARSSTDAISLQIQSNGAQGGWYNGNFSTTNGKYDVKEVFGETVVPVLHDVPFSKALDLNGAVRLTDYSTFGSVTTWKLPKVE